MSKRGVKNLSFVGKGNDVELNLDKKLFFENFIAPEYVNTEFAARLLGISENAVRIKVCRGKIPAYKFGRCLRFKLSEINHLFSRKE